MTKYQQFTSDSSADIFPQINGKGIQSNVDNVKQTSYKDSRVYYRLTFSSCSFLIITEELRRIRRYRPKPSKTLHAVESQPQMGGESCTLVRGERASCDVLEETCRSNHPKRANRWMLFRLGVLHGVCDSFSAPKEPEMESWTHTRLIYIML